MRTEGMAKLDTAPAYEVGDCRFESYCPRKTHSCVARS